MNILLSLMPLVNIFAAAGHDDHDHAHEEGHGHEEAHLHEEAGHAGEALHGHSHGGGDGGWFGEYLALLQDPAHIAFEITISILFDIFIVYLGYQLIVKRVIIPRLRHQIHQEIDAEHHVDHHDHVAGDDEDNKPSGVNSAT
jgi:hypothetical protein